MTSAPWNTSTTKEPKISYVTTVIVISPHMTFPDDVNEYLTKLHHRDYYEEGDRLPVISWDMAKDRLFAGGKVPGGSMIWMGWNYCPLNTVIEGLRQFEDLTVWWETEGTFMGTEQINNTYPHI